MLFAPATTCSLFETQLAEPGLLSVTPVARLSAASFPLEFGLPLTAIDLLFAPQEFLASGGLLELLRRVPVIPVNSDQARSLEAPASTLVSVFCLPFGDEPASAFPCSFANEGYFPFGRVS